MTIREIKAMNRQITHLMYKLERLRSDTTNVTSSLSDLPSSRNVSDKLGETIAEIVEIDDKITTLTAERDRHLNRLSLDVDEENCIYLFLVRGYSWRQIAQVTDGRLDTVNSIKKRCYKYDW